eukprot:TRINITY_DN4696_c0_g1_i4.p1 TRINITY_DN4696_c0_g1~~TRINITY_DN4696_c0_g1_i4.p1  ORF type:complete len:273 (+),score=52.44 TRINITY_DN4696_c0_g1_i4:71-820(+)
MTTTFGSSISRPFTAHHTPHSVIKKRILVKATNQDFGRDVFNTTLGFTLSASLLIGGDLSAQAAIINDNFAGETLTAVRQKIGQDLSQNFQQSLNNKVAVTSSKRAEIFEKLREEAEEGESSPSTSSVTRFVPKPAAAKETTQFKLQKSAVAESGDGTFNSSQPVYIGGAVALAAVVGGVLFTNMKSSSSDTAASAPPTAGSSAKPQNSSQAPSALAEAEAWVANWKKNGAQQMDAESWVANWRAKQQK